MGKAISATIVTLNKEIAPIQTPDEGNKADFITKEDPKLKNDFNDLGEIEDLYEIYGEMSNTL
jgi:hypothetical protein